ncbi:MAG: TlpA disulfide reductase family protein [Acidobacteriota bacterium]
MLAGLAFVILLPLFNSTFWAADAKVKIGELPKDAIARRSLRMTDGRQFTLAEMRGKVVVLDFFAVWCGHSRQHIPTMTKFTEEDTKRGLQIIGLAVDDAESTPKRVAEFIQQMKITYPVGMIEDPVFTKFVESKDVSVPQTLIYGRDGKLVAYFNGHDSTVDAEITATIKRELSKQ